MAIFSKEALKAKPKKTLQTHTILIVDDEENNLLALTELLSKDYEILTAKDGQEALEYIQKDDNPERIHLIISDQRMPRLTGVEFLEKTVATIPRTIRIILTGFTDIEAIIDSINRACIYKYINKPYDNQDMRVTIKRAIEAFELEERNALLIDDLNKTNQALQAAMKNLQTVKIISGVYWVQVPEADLYILCGCPADIVKHLMRKGFNATAKKGDISFETGPNAILLSDMLIQNGNFSNLAEFPVLQMLYRQGMILPNHPNNTGTKPLLIGTEEQVKAQMEYIYRGNYGLTSMEEILEAGVDGDSADEMMRLKMKFAFGKIRPTEELLESRIIEDESVEIKNGVYARRVGLNQYEFQYKGKSTVVDLNLKANETYESPYELGFRDIKREYFAVIHSGEGDGWDIHRPSMASILMFQGDIYLVDAGPNILHTLRALSIDISEISGIFHTHAHDDHFSGLPTLMQSDHRIKYYATPLVRASVSKKLSTLMSIDESKFSQYFEIHDLIFDKWNYLEGLEVKPMFSPHPLETNIFLFRALGEDGYKTYAHWADITSFDVFKQMVATDSPQEGVSQEFFDKVKTDYLIPADLKKVDIGAGLIHGQAKDFDGDKSEEIILAHTSTNLTLQQKEIGSERSFGTVDILISTTQDYLKRQAYQFLREFFPKVPLKRLQVLLTCPVVSFNPGTMIQKKGESVSNIFLILTGSVEFIHPDFEIQNTLSNGCFIGDVSLLRNTPLPGTWRSVSHVQALRFPASLYRTFLEESDLYEHMKSIQDNIEFLQGTWLFGEGISYLVQNKIAQLMSQRDLTKGELITKGELLGIYLIKEGELQIMNSKEEEIETLKPGEFFGEEVLFPEVTTDFQFKATKPSVFYLINESSLLEIPIVHWKLLEIIAKRTRILERLQ